MANTGVFPVGDNKFKIGTSSSALNTIAELTTFSVAFANSTQTWTAMDAGGWQSALMTGKACTLTLNGKRSAGDKGNDFVAGMAWKNGQDAYAQFEWEFPDGTKVAGKVVVDVKNINGGESTDVGPLEFDLIFSGKPTVTTSGSLPA